jgi:Transposase, Mutator family
MERRPHEGRPGSLGELIHMAVRHAIEVAVDVELTTALGAPRYVRCGSRCGYRNGTKPRTLTGPTGPLALTVPRATVFTPTGSREWRSALLPRYHRRLREVNEAVVATYLAGGNTRRLRGALSPLLKAAPLSKSAVSRIVGTLKAELEAWRTRSLATLDVLGLYLDALALRVRSAGRVVSVSFAKTASGSLGDDQCSREDPTRQEASGRLVRSRAVRILRPSALPRQAVDLSVGRMAAGREDSDRHSAGGGGPARRCWTMPPAGHSDDAGPRLRESARPCPPPVARSAARRAYPSRARGECERGDSTWSSRPRDGGGASR